MEKDKQRGMGTRLPWWDLQDSQGRAARIGWPAEDWNNATRAEQNGEDSQKGTARKGQPERDSQNETARTGQPERDRQD
jgi:hypothetical protein